MRKLMAANWKMFKTREQAQTTVTALCKAITPLADDKEVVIFAPFPAIANAVEACSALADVAIGAQNFYPAKEGAFTGEISLGMLEDVGATWVLVGHSERRQIFAESDAFLEEKASYALKEGMKIIFCVGESLAEREAGSLQHVLEQQLACLARLAPMLDVQNFAVAYEPVWAIGTGKVAGPEEICAAHALVRNILVSHVGDKGNAVRILYGGSVKPDNTAAIIKLDNTDGVLVGGASLEAESFARIVTA